MALPTCRGAAASRRGMFARAAMLSAVFCALTSAPGVFGAPSASARAPARATPPKHLVVLAHGLGGTSRDLLRFEQALMACDASVLALAISGNEGRTKDGVRAGSARVEREVRAAVANHPSLRRISFVGNSLGGLYVREAACALHEPRRPFGLRGERIAGLAPEAFVTIASPHLGTRLLPWCPPALQGLPARAFAGQTASDLFLRTLVLADMTDERHLRALRAFRRRVLYANAGGDAMVQPYTAAIDGARRGVGPRERKMASRLRSMPWRTVLVEFRWLRFVPIAHNMICALSRDAVCRAVFARGGAVVDDAAASVCCSCTRPAQLRSTCETFRA
ncbi:hypothetical protein KFE25_007646 [Diacronema lutheri]|uniref:DUF676 domain-containing protein n=1 Tax=Diacronema lutheri TaxID=2081491 RepID=A0A8J5XJR6_DIALT|nr:hypothetical protein KFE25_007646 [Diacronema lutheri]